MKIQNKHLAVAFALMTTTAAVFAAEQYGASGRSETGTHSSSSSRETKQNGRAETQFSGRITGVNKRDKTITIEDRQMGRETLHIGSDTRVMKGSEAAGWDQIREGEQVRATARKSGDMNHALSVEIGR